MNLCSYVVAVQIMGANFPTSLPEYPEEKTARESNSIFHIIHLNRGFEILGELRSTFSILYF